MTNSITIIQEHWLTGMVRIVFALLVAPL